MQGIDSLIAGFDLALRTVSGVARSARPLPGKEIAESDLSDVERRHAGALMRVNHVGEVCAQALYQGQALSCRDESLRRELGQAAREEGDHLAWTAGRIAELGTRTSLLNPFWYGGALGIGMLAGRAGDAWNLGFLAETERQVEAHLDHHLSELPVDDRRSRTIVEQMKADEAGHAATAERLGARSLPVPLRLAMRAAASVMTRTAYYL